MDHEAPDKLHLADYVRPVWQRKWLILVAIVVATAGVYVYYAGKPKVYSASTLVYTKNPGDPVSGAANVPSGDRDVQNQAALLYSREVAADVKTEINYPDTPQRLLRSVAIAARTGEDFVSITANAGNPELAAAIANGYAKEFVKRSNGRRITRIREARQIAQRQLDRIPRGTNRTTRDQIEGQIRNFDLALAVPASSAQQVNPAVAPKKPIEPKPFRNALFAFVLSLVLAVTIAFSMERFDRRIKRAEDIEPTYGLPLLAVLPHSPEPAPVTDGLVTLDPAFRESFRALRTNIDLASLDRPAKTILVSSAVPGEGKSTVARNLALVYRETGKRVAIVEADLRRPALGNLFGHDSDKGLTEVLGGEITLTEAISQVRVQVPGLEALIRLTGEERASGQNGHAVAQTSEDEANDKAGSISVLLCGSRPANPPAVLASTRVTEVLDELAAAHDIVIIDSAPLLSVTDTVPLLRYADSVVLVGRLGRTTRDTARRLVEFVHRVPDVPVIGVVANDLSQLEATGYGYGYGSYGYGRHGYYVEKEEKSKSKSTV